MLNIFNETKLNLFYFIPFLWMVLFSFYYYIKGFLFKLAPTIASKTIFIQNHPHNQVVGVIELAAVSICHALFCIFLIYMFDIDITFLSKETSYLSCLYAVLIGIGAVGFSILVCSIGMKILEIVAKDKTPRTLEGWMTVANAGWMRHHKHTIKILPMYLALIIITLQIGSEEIIFRAVLIQTLLPYGVKVAFIISTFLFIYMQILYMPSIASAMFPVVGATIMGITHGLLYLYNPSIAPLIISHLAFFIFAVI